MYVLVQNTSLHLPHEMLCTENSINLLFYKYSRVKLYVSKNKVVFFDFTDHKKIALDITKPDYQSQSIEHFETNIRKRSAAKYEAISVSKKVFSVPWLRH